MSVAGKNALISGATSGIGKETALALADMGANVCLIGRDQSKTENLCELISQRSSDATVDYLLADLSSQVAIRELAAQYQAKHGALDILVNNAGALFAKRVESVDGFEYTWALNHLNYFLLTTLLKENLVAAPEARVINVASAAHMRGRMHWDDLQLERDYSFGGWTAYCQSKLANILFTRELSRRFEGTSVKTNCVHPGFVNTGFAKNNGSTWRAMMWLSRPFQRNVGNGADTVIWAASSVEAKEYSGEYFSNRKVRRPTKSARNAQDAERLWSLSEEMTGTSGSWKN